MPDFIGERSWLLFHLVDATGLWLNEDPTTWEVNDEYRRMNDIVITISVVNDTAERGVKDIEDYANASRDGDHRDRIVLKA